MKNRSQKFIEEVISVLDSTLKGVVYEKFLELHNVGIGVFNVEINLYNMELKSVLKKYNLDTDISVVACVKGKGEIPLKWIYNKREIKALEGDLLSKDDFTILELLEKVTQQKTHNPKFLHSDDLDGEISGLVS